MSGPHLVMRHLAPGLAWPRRRRPPGRPALHHCLVWLLLVASTALPASAQAPLETSVKAAYLYKFLGFVDWPAPLAAAPDKPLTIGVLEADALHAALQQTITGRRVHGRPLVAKKLNPGEPLADLHAVYLGQDADAAAVIAELKGQSVLVVTDTPDGPAAGAMLNFLLVDGRVRFEASPHAALAAGLRLSARLLAVAERVVAP